MGPRSTDRGNDSAMGWTRRRKALLQWGRDRLIAEIRRSAQSVRRDCDASMGPRSTDRGNESNVRKEKTNMKLQWGRDRLIAEMSSSASTQRIWRRFNGAAID